MELHREQNIRGATEKWEHRASAIEVPVKIPFCPNNNEEKICVDSSTAERTGFEEVRIQREEERYYTDEKMGTDIIAENTAIWIAISTRTQEKYING